jgi:hypothetical protein
VRGQKIQFAFPSAQYFFIASIMAMQCMVNRYKSHHTQQLNDTVAYHIGETSQLNALFGLEMMGFPPDWTLKPFQKQNGEKRA